MTHDMCTRCVLTSTTPGIVFDEKGACNYCHAHKPMEVEGEAALISTLNRFKARGAKYDCMVGVSGGRDSTYTLWKLVHDYGLRVLAVNYRNPFTSAQARQNMRRAAELLKVDLYDWEFPGDVHRQATIKALKVWARHPSSAMIPIVCAHCKTMWPTLYQIARQNEVSLIVVGSNPLETASFKQAGMGGARYYHQLSRLPRLVRKSLGELIRNPRYLTSCSWRTVFRMYLYAGHNSPILRRRFGDITVLRLFDYLKWNEKEVLETITKNLDWQKAPEVASSWRFDCRLDFVRRRMYQATVGVTELRDLFSKMIREGIMTREEALRRLAEEDVVPDAVAEEVLSEIGFKLADLNLKGGGKA